MKHLSKAKLLSYQEVLELLKGTQHEDLVLVGGQAVLVYAHLYHLEDVVIGVSGDLDLLGSVSSAKRFAAKFESMDSLRIADISDNTLNTAILAVNLNALCNDPIVVDFIANIGGLEAREVAERALQVDLSGGVVKVIHPFHLLQSKLHNIVHIPQKETVQSLRQLELTLRIAELYFKEIIADPKRFNRAKLNATENLFTILSSDDALKVNAIYGPIDLMRPIRENPPNVEFFKSTRLPQMTEFINRKIGEKKEHRIWQENNTKTKSKKTKIGTIKF